MSGRGKNEVWESGRGRMKWARELMSECVSGRGEKEQGGSNE